MCTLEAEEFEVFLLWQGCKYSVFVELATSAQLLLQNVGRCCWTVSWVLV